jgi:uncharacterized membrane protein YfcA
VGTFWLVLLGMVSGAGAGLLAGLIGIGGGIVVVPIVFYGLVGAGTPADQAAHVAVGTSLAAILPAALVSSVAHWRAGNTDVRFLRDWGPGIAIGVVVAQLAAPHVRGSVMTGLFALLCLIFAARFAFPGRFAPIRDEPPSGAFPTIAGVTIGLSSGLAGVGGGILTNIVMTLAGMPMHKSIGRAAAAGVGGQPARHPRRSVGDGSHRSDTAGQYRSRGVGFGRADAGSGGMVWGTTGAAYRRRQSEPDYGCCAPRDRRCHAVFQRNQPMIRCGEPARMLICDGRSG